jgi:cell division protein FtsI/penicillin-binding protein 2
LGLAAKVGHGQQAWQIRICEYCAASDGEGVRWVRKRWKVTSAGAVRGHGAEIELVDPTNGSVLATASAPRVDLKAAVAFARKHGGPALPAFIKGPTALTSRAPPRAKSRRSAKITH